MNLTDGTLKEIVELFKLFISNDYQTILKVAVKQGAELSGCQRCCLILFNKEDELVIKGGFPKGAHGLRMKVSDSLGGDFLRSIIEKKKEVLITNPLLNPNLGYMRDLIKGTNTTSILFVPFHHKDDSLGIMIFDGQGSYEFTDCIQNRIRLLVGLISNSLGVLYETYSDEEKILRKEKLCELGKNYAGITHTVRNAHTAIGGLARRILKKTSSDNKKKVDKKTIYRYAEQICSASEEVEDSLNNVLEFVSFSPDKLKLKKN